ncbi:MAG: ABC transporter permease [Clostridia bacterium]|nr:ABC transporter permease [Clostridia bacterium]
MPNLAFEPLSETWRIVSNEFPFALWETLYATVLATAMSIVLGMPLGVLLVAGEEDGILPLPKWLMQVLNVVINILRSVPFIILMVLVIPLTRLIVGKAYGTMASVVPLVIAAFPFIARLVESSLREVDPNLIEMARSMGATPFQIITKVMLRESVPSLISNLTIAITTILGYTAMSGAVGGGGLGKLAITYGYNRYMNGVMAAAVILLVVLVQLFQMIGTKSAIRNDKRQR